MIVLKYKDIPENDVHIYVDIAGTGKYPYQSRLENAHDFETVKAAEEYNERFNNHFTIEQI